MRRRWAAVLGTAAIVAALGLAGCSSHPAAPDPATEPAPPSTTSAVLPQPGGLPAPEALTEVLYRLADPGVPGAEKLNLVEGTTVADAATLDKFAKALLDNGYTPPTFEATDIAWADSDPTDVVATIAANKPDTEDGFSIPMEFKPHQGGWRLSQDTFDMLLNFETPAAAPPR